MDKASLGTRWVCFECQTSFFDLNKEKAICPKCGADQDNNPSRILLTKQQQKPKEPEREPELLDDDIDFEDDSGELGIESFEQLEEAVEEDDEEGEDEFV